MRHRLREHLAFQQLLQLLGHVVEGIGQRPHQCGAGARRTRVSWPSRIRRAAWASCETSRHSR